MFYNRHYVIYRYDETLKTILENEYSIDVVVLNHVTFKVPFALVFDVPESHPRIDQLNSILPTEAALAELHEVFEHYTSHGGFITYEPVYSKNELESAKWLEARNITSKVTPVNCETVDSCQCFVKTSRLGQALGRHEIQNEPYVIRSPIKWGRSSFISAYCHEERLFCNDISRALLTSHNISGIEFIPVVKQVTGQPIDSTYQLDFTHTVPDGAVVSIAGMEDYVCDQCGMHMLRWGDGRSRFGLLDNVLDEKIDCWQTLPMFLGRAPTDALNGQRRLIISQKMYRILFKNKMDRGFIFTPLDTVAI